VSGGTITCHVVDHVATIVVDRVEKRNAFTPAMIHQLDAVIEELEAMPGLRVVVVTGAGDVSFSSGADLASFAAQSRESAWQRWVPLGHRVFGRLAALPIPTVALLNGDAFGGGLELALCCDLRLACDRVSLGLPEVGLGTLPGWGGTARLLAVVGPARARQMILTGRPVQAVEAEQWGLVTECAGAADLDALLAEYVEALRSRAPIAVSLAKAVLDAHSSVGRPTEVLEALACALTVTTDDLAEGIGAFRAKRRPEFEAH
jgi:enoyl-CoA hydratase